MQLRLWAAVCCALLMPEAWAEGVFRTDTPFDYWTLSLSWSPQYCHANFDSKEPQCVFENYFVLHGLRPHVSGDGDSGCEGESKLSAELLAKNIDLVPNRSVLLREWRQHGRCSGIGQAEYFVQLEYASRKLRIPSVYAKVTKTLKTTAQEIKNRFIEANPDLQESGIQLVCTGEMLKEINICFDKAFAFRRCELELQNRCEDSVKLLKIRFDRIGREQN
jgi:ribonuclease T2